MTNPLAAALALPPGRQLIAVAGPPGSGKSTLAQELAWDLTMAGRPAQVVPMDGFHLDNTLLDIRGLRARKGAPGTFDARGFHRLLADILTGGPVIFPHFDRTRDLAVAGAGALAEDTELVVVEGNYLLFDHPDWAPLAQLWAMSVWLDVPRDVLHDRLVQRWRDFGFDETTARTRAEGNDLPNAERIAAHRLPATLTLSA